MTLKFFFKLCHRQFEILCFPKHLIGDVIFTDICTLYWGGPGGGGGLCTKNLFSLFYITNQLNIIFIIWDWKLKKECCPFNVSFTFNTSHPSFLSPKLQNFKYQSSGSQFCFRRIIEEPHCTNNKIWTIDRFIFKLALNQLDTRVT